MGVFSFWELSFSGIFVKLSKEWDPSVWLVPSSNVSLPIILCLFSFSIFFLLPRAFSSYLPFIAPPQASTTTPIVTIMSNHHEQPQVITIKLSLDWFISVSNFVIWVSGASEREEQEIRETMSD